MDRRTVPVFLTLIVALAFVTLALPKGVAACTCISRGIDTAGTQPDMVVFSGVTEPRDIRGFPVRITRWFKWSGDMPERVWLDPRGFNGASMGSDCTIPQLPIGFEFIVASSATDGRYHVGACTPRGEMQTPEGQALLADAMRVFGTGASPPTVPPSTPPPARPAPSQAGGNAVQQQTFNPASPVALLALVAVVGLVAGAIATRRRLGGRDL